MNPITCVVILCFFAASAFAQQSETKRLQKEHESLLQHLVKMEQERVDSGMGTRLQVVEAKIKLLEYRAEICTDRTQKLAILREVVQLHGEKLAQAEAQAKVGTGGADVISVKLAWLAASEKLAALSEESK